MCKEYTTKDMIIEITADGEYKDYPYRVQVYDKNHALIGSDDYPSTMTLGELFVECANNATEWGHTNDELKEEC